MSDSNSTNSFDLIDDFNDQSRLPMGFLQINLFLNFLIF